MGLPPCQATNARLGPAAIQTPFSHKKRAKKSPFSAFFLPVGLADLVIGAETKAKPTLRQQ